MRHAFTAKELASRLGVDAARAGELIALACTGPRDLFNADDLVALEAAKELLDLRVPRARIVAALTDLRAHQRAALATGAPSQAAFDFAGTSVATVKTRGPAMTRNAESLFAAAVQLEERDPAQAVDTYTEAVAANPLHADAHVNLGRLLHQRGRLREAEAHYVAALVSQPADVTALFNLAVVLEDLGRTDAAIARYQEAIRLDPGCVDAYYNLARLYERKGEKMAAIRHLKDYRRLTQQP